MQSACLQMNLLYVWRRCAACWHHWAWKWLLGGGWERKDLFKIQIYVLI